MDMPSFYLLALEVLVLAKNVVKFLLVFFESVLRLLKWVKHFVLHVSHTYH